MRTHSVLPGNSTRMGTMLTSASMEGARQRQEDWGQGSCLNGQESPWAEGSRKSENPRTQGGSWWVPQGAGHHS